MEGFTVDVPSQQKVDGHTRYTIAMWSFGGSTPLHFSVEKRRSEIEREVKDVAVRCLGDAAYGKEFSSCPFPSKFSLGIAAKLKAWIQLLLDKTQDPKHLLSRPSPRTQIFTFFKVPKSAETSAEGGAAAASTSSSPPRAVEGPPREVAALASRAPVAEAPSSVPPGDVVLKHRSFKPLKTFTRLFTKSTADLPYAKLRFTALGRSLYAFNALAYFASVLAHAPALDVGGAPSSSDVDGTLTEAPGLGVLVLMLLGLGNIHACFSEERSPRIFQQISVTILWLNDAMSFLRIGVRCWGLALPEALSLTNDEQRAPSLELVFLIVNVAIGGLGDVDCTVGLLMNE